jgi:urease accessory protein
MKPRYLIALALCTLPMFANAHPGHDGHGLVTGMAHPWMGMDHLITMLAVGMWAAQLGGRMRWVVPTSFIGMMLVGTLLGFAGVHLGAVEQSIAASLCVMGLLLAAAIRLPLVACVAMVGSFAVFHGYAHATEAGTNNALLYIAGFAISTAALHALGIGVAMLLSQHQRLIRWVGAAVAVSGVAIFVM